jgi:hypothetical protein
MPVPHSAPPSSALPLREKNVPAFVLSELAAHEKTEKDDRIMISTLLRQKQACDDKLTELTKQNHQLRTIAERKTKEAATVNRHLVALQKQNEELVGERIVKDETAVRVAKRSSAKPPVATSVVAASRAKELTKQNTGLRDELKTTSLALGNAEMQVKILEDALAIKAEEVGLRGSKVLAEVAHLRGELANMRAERARLEADSSLMEEAVASSIAENAALTSELEAVRKSESTMKQQFTLLGGDTLRELESEKNALLDYVTESLDSVASLEGQNAELSHAVADLKDFRVRCETLKDEAVAAARTAAELELKLKESSQQEQRSIEQLEDQKAEMDEMARMQIELLEQISASESAKHKLGDDSSALKNELAERQEQIAQTRQNLVATNEALNATNSDLADAKSKLASIVPKMDSADAELRILRTRLAELEKTESENARMQAELTTLRPLKESLECVAGDIRGVTYGSVSAGSKYGMDGFEGEVAAAVDASHRIAGDPDTAKRQTRTQWHAGWVNAGSLMKLLPSLGDRVQTLFTDLAMAESQLNDVTRVMSNERKDRDMERRVLSDTCISKEQECKELSKRLKANAEEIQELRSQNERAKGSEAATAQMRTLWLAHCQEEGGGDVANNEVADLEIVHSVARALYTGRQASARANQTLQKLVECEAMINMRGLEVARLQGESDDMLKQLTTHRASSEADIAGLRSEEAALAAELESAAELAERQGALAVTLEGRLEALSAERAMLSSQFHASQKELGDLGRDLREALFRCNERGSGVVQEADGVVVSNNSGTSAVVRSAVVAIDAMNERIGSVQRDLIAAQAKAEMNEVGLLARNNHVLGCTRQASPAATPVRSAVADLETTELLMRQKAQVGEMQHKWGLQATPQSRSRLDRQREQQERIDSISKSVASVRSLGSAMDTPVQNNRGGETGGGSVRGRAPSPGTQLLQERLRKAQAAFATLSK